MTVSRYRREGESFVIELRVRESRQLFDLRDPAPFRERDLDPGAVEYVLEAAEETPTRAPLQIEVHIAGAADAAVGDDEIRAAVRNHFKHLRAVQGMRIRNHLSQGRTATVVGVVVLTVCLLAAHSIDPSTTWQAIAQSGLEIGGWVAIWRPVEHFLYDWWPILGHRRLLDRILAAPVEIRWGAPLTRTMTAVAEPS